MLCLRNYDERRIAKNQQQRLFRQSHTNGRSVFCDVEASFYVAKKKHSFLQKKKESDVNASQPMSLSMILMCLVGLSCTFSRESIRRLEKEDSEMHATEHHVDENRHNCCMEWTSIEIIWLHSQCADDEARAFSIESI